MKQRYDDLSKLSPDERVALIEHTRNALPEELKKARVTRGRKTDNGWIVNLVTSGSEVGRRGKRWVVEMTRDHVNVIPV